jgi:hypothetical protein
MARIAFGPDMPQAWNTRPKKFAWVSHEGNHDTWYRRDTNPEHPQR